MNPSRMRLEAAMGLWPSTQVGVYLMPTSLQLLGGGWRAESTQRLVCGTPQPANPESPTAPDLAHPWTKQTCHPTFQQGTSLSKISQQVRVEPGLQPGPPAAHFGLVPHLGCPNPQEAQTLPSA